MCHCDEVDINIGLEFEAKYFIVFSSVVPSVPIVLPFLLK
jgi:hypothetical protein